MCPAFYFDRPVNQISLVSLAKLERTPHMPRKNKDPNQLQLDLKPKQRRAICDVNDETRHQITTAAMQGDLSNVDCDDDTLSLALAERVQLFALIKADTKFSRKGNDPHGTHEFGKIRFNGRSYYWYVSRTFKRLSVHAGYSFD
jgi:hypothetical protein